MAQRRSCRRLRHLEAHSRATQLEISIRPPDQPGTRLVRQWREQVHVVKVEAKGYEYKVSIRSLSEIARRITGTRWSGPLFFGLKGEQAKES